MLFVFEAARNGPPFFDPLLINGRTGNPQPSPPCSLITVRASLSSRSPANLSKRDRSLITVAAPIALNRPDQLRFHLGKAVENGVKKEELIEAITHLAFYAGWPNAMTAIQLAKELFEKADGK
jgi:4-carboxymuconolactone decarboxylase